MPVGTQRSSKTLSTQAETAVSSVTLHNSSPLPIFPLCLLLLPFSLSFTLHSFPQASLHLPFFSQCSPSSFTLLLPKTSPSLPSRSLSSHLLPLLFHKPQLSSQARQVLCALLCLLCRGAGAGGPGSCISLACLLYPTICPFYPSFLYLQGKRICTVFFLNYSFLQQFIEHLLCA